MSQFFEGNPTEERKRASARDILCRLTMNENCTKLISSTILPMMQVRRSTLIFALRLFFLSVKTQNLGLGLGLYHKLSQKDVGSFR